MTVYYVIARTFSLEHDDKRSSHSTAKVVRRANPGNPLGNQHEDYELVAGPLQDEALACLVADSATDQTEILEALS